MRVTFEEKTYESYFNIELSKKTAIFFPLGQVQEGSLGCDAVAYSFNKHIWRRIYHPFGIINCYPGVDFRAIADEMEHWLNVELNNIPLIKINLLFQYKKPEYITKNTGTSEWKAWNEKYYRYDIYQEQQDLLDYICGKFNKKVLVLYAAPAIHDVNELVKAFYEGNIINYSNFRKAEDLSGHHRNTYTRAGNNSIAFSEMEIFDNIDLISLLEESGRRSEESNKEIIINFASEIRKLILEYNVLSEPFKKILNQIESYENFKLLYSYQIMNIFKNLTGIQWLMKI